MACSPNPGWRPSSFSLQSAAAQIVLEGTADGRFSCQSFGSQADDAKKEYHLKDEERGWEGQENMRVEQAISHPLKGRKQKNRTLQMLFFDPKSQNDCNPGGTL